MIRRFSFFLVLCLTLLLCASCGSYHSIVPKPFDWINAPKDPLEEITIDGNTYPLVIMDSFRSTYTGEPIDRYAVEGFEDSTIITVDRKSGELLGFYGITLSVVLDPTLSKREATEKALANKIDFSQYDTVKESPLAIYYWNTECADIDLEVYFTANGEIHGISKNDAAPATHLSLDEETRDKLIFKALKKKKAITSEEGLTLHIHSQTYTVYHGKDAVKYTVSCTDTKGISTYSYVVVIWQ